MGAQEVIELYKIGGLGFERYIYKLSGNRLWGFRV